MLYFIFELNQGSDEISGECGNTVERATVFAALKPSRIEVCTVPGCESQNYSPRVRSMDPMAIINKSTNVSSQCAPVSEATISTINTGVRN